MPDDPFIETVRVWAFLNPTAGRALRETLLDMQSTTDFGGGAADVAAAAGPAEDAGVAGPTKGGGGMNGETRPRATEEQMHAMLRREMCASADLAHWTKMYRERPHDATGMYLHAAWLEMRAAVDALAAFDPPSFDKLSLAASPEVA